ncbi:MAG: ParB/RepB/Spo0J family partition protein [Candidatus Roizmanbacteria bacterium]|nr:ParB/RepB/Spo0J family partition protein [Candidatus Roizmanbacteria bacterium]
MKTKKQTVNQVTAEPREEDLEDLFTFLPLKDLFFSKTNPRKRSRDNDESLNELSESIKSIGLINPITVRRRYGIINAATGKEFDPYYEIVSGSRRYMAASIANLSEIPCIIKNLSDKDVLEIQVIENLQRKDLHPLDEAEAFNYLLETQSYNQESIAARIGKSLSYVYKRMQLLNLSEELKKDFYEGNINQMQALLISRLTIENQNKLLKYYRDISEVSLTMLKKDIESKFHLSLDNAVFDKADKTLIDGISSCINCPKRTGYNPQLFDDYTEIDETCTDADCFNAKVKAHIARELANKDNGLIPISTMYYSDGDRPDDLLASGEYEIYDPDKHESDADFIDAIVIEENRNSYYGSKLKLGEKVKVRLTTEEKTEKDEEYTEEELEKHRKEREKEDEKRGIERKVEDRLKNKLIDEIIRLVPMKVDELLLDLVTTEIADQYLGGCDENLLHRHGIEESSPEWSNYENNFMEYLKNRGSIKERFKVLLEFMLLLDKTHANGEIIKQYVEAYGIDIANFKKDITKEVKKEIKKQKEQTIPQNKE